MKAPGALQLAAALLLSACVRREVVDAGAAPPVAPPVSGARFYCHTLAFDSGVAVEPCARSLDACEAQRAAPGAGAQAGPICAAKGTAWCFHTEGGEVCDANADSCVASRRGFDGYRGPCFEIHASWPAAAPGRAPFWCTRIRARQGAREECYRTGSGCRERFVEVAGRDEDAEPCRAIDAAVCHVTAAGGERCAPDVAGCEADRRVTGGEACAIVRAN